MINSQSRSSSNRASTDGTGDGKPEPSHVWHTMLDESPNCVAPKIWCDLHLLRILTEGRETPFLSSRGGEISLAFASFALTRPFWISETLKASEEGLVPSPSPWPWPFHSLNLSHSHSGNLGIIWGVRNLKKLKDLWIMGNDFSPCVYYRGQSQWQSIRPNLQEGITSGINLTQFPK